MNTIESNPRKVTKLAMTAILLVLAMFTVAMTSADSHANETATYRVTIANFTGGQPFTPPLIATHSRNVSLLGNSSVANIGIQEIAENGNLDPMVALLEASPAVSDYVIAVAGDPPPLMPGNTITIDITGDADAKYLSFISMLICTNDGFTAVDSIELPKHVGDTTAVFANAYDAGTEVNTEDFSDMVPPCSALTGIDTDKTGTGMSNPDLAENGTIERHPGIVGLADLVPDLHGWNGEVAAIKVERVD